MTAKIAINSNVKISRSELRFKFARSGGKGGQNVNKVETKVELLFDVASSPSLTDDQRALIQERLAPQIDAVGVLHVVAQESRSQWRNRELAVERFIDVLKKALKPKKKRVATKIPKASKEKRLGEKKRRSEIKKFRAGRE